MEGTIRGIADRLLSAVARQCAAEVEQLRLVAELVDASCVVPRRTVIGGERLVDSGSDGTPQVAEFLVPELAAMLGVGIPTAWALIRDVMNLRHRHPRAWAALGQESMTVWQARKMASMCAAAELGAEAARWVDARLQSSWGRLPWPRIRRKAEGLIVSADRELARQRADARRTERYVYLRHEGDGSSLMVARMNTADAVQLSRAIDTIADSMVMEGRAEPLPELRSEALSELAKPSDRGTLPRHSSTLVVHVSRESVENGGGAAREDAVGPLLLEEVRDLLAHDRVRVLPVLDLAGDAGADSYEIPDRIREQVRIRDSFSVFPFSTTRSINADLDHTRPFECRGADQKHAPPRQTRPSNLGPLGRLEHRAKTHGGWRVEQSEPGAFEWRSPLGYAYRVGNGYTDPDTTLQEAHPPGGDKVPKGAVEFMVPPCVAVIDYAA